MHLLLFLAAVFVETGSGLPATVDYQVPRDFQTEYLREDSTWTVLEGNSGVFTVVPLVLSDTLRLPALAGWNESGDTLLFQPPEVIVVPSFPDTLMSPSFPAYPCFMDIPPGLPEDYAGNLSFWLVWTRRPPFPWLWVSLGVVSVALAVWFFLSRRKPHADTVTPEERIPAGSEAEREALALLSGENFLHGRWVLLYTEINRQYRATVAGRFGVVNRALTLKQISRSLPPGSDSRRFLEESSELVREITLQIYADWGSSREKSAAFIRKLAHLRKEWSR